MTIEERVAAGAALLDRKRPGWENEINPTTLNLVSYTDCVLAQLYGGFLAGQARLFPNEKHFDVGMVAKPDTHHYPAFTHGFMPPEDLSDAWHDYGGVEAQALTAEWKRVITERRLLSK